MFGMQDGRVKISISLSRDLVARIDRAARAEARPRSRVLEDWLRRTARENAARDLEEATVAYYESLTADERREDAAMATASSRAARHLAVDRVPAAGRRQPRKR
jgi:metal-responsive CopG/Arc/MetJ family transcriptional regulator